MSENIRVYADYTGCGVSSPQLREAAANLVLSQPLYGNPHSAHVLGLQSSADINSARASMLTFFDAWEEYDVVFTAGATASLRVAQEIFASMPIAPFTAVGQKMLKDQKQQDKEEKEEDLTAACTRPSSNPRNDKYRQRIAYFCHWAAHTSLIGIRAHHQMVKFRGFRHEGDAVRRFPEPVSNNNNTFNPEEEEERPQEEILENPPTSEVTEFPLLDELLKEEYENAKKYLESSSNSNDETEEVPPPTCIIVSLPLECNFSGARIPLTSVTRMVEQFREKYGDLLDVHFLMDGAAASSKTPVRLDGSDVAAHCCSLYKMAGLPFGVGALFVKKDLIERNSEQRLLHDGRSFYGGGTVEALAMSSEFVSLHPGTHAWEDGTPNISALQLVPAALRQVGLGEHSLNNNTSTITTDGGDINFQKNDISSNITTRAVRYEKLRRRLKNGLKALRHHNGIPVVHFLDSFFGDADGTRRDADENSTSEEYWCQHQGAVVSFVLRTDTGLPVGHQLVERLALAHGICLRTGCFCNTGSCQVFLGLTDESLRQYLKEGHICGGPVDIIDDGTRPRGAVRLSLGWTSTEAEIDEIIAWARACFVFSAPPPSPSATATTSSTGVTTTNNTDNYDEFLSIKNQRRARIKRMWVYPVKGLNGTECASWRIDPNTGALLLDRRFAIVDRVSGQLVSPKNNQRLSQIDATLRLQEGVMIFRATTRDFDPLAIALPSDVTDLDPAALSSCVPTAGHAVSTYTKMQIRIKQTGNSIHRATKEYEAKVNIRGHRVGTKMMSFEKEVDDWLSAVLRQSVRLIMTTNESKQQQQQEVTSSSNAANFANRDQSLLLISSNSHLEVERHTPEGAKRQLDVRKYRANLYVDVLYNAEPTASLQGKRIPQILKHSRQTSLQDVNELDVGNTNNNSNAEDQQTQIFPEQHWKKIIAPWATFSSVGTCHRCEQVNANPSTYQIEAQPLAALVSIAGTRLKQEPSSQAHLEDGVAQQRGGVSSAPTLGQLFKGAPSAPRSDILKNIEAAAAILGSRGAQFLGKNGELMMNNTNTTTTATAISKKKNPFFAAIKQRLFPSSKRVSDRTVFKSYYDQIVMSMLFAAIGTFVYARRTQYKCGRSLADYLDTILPNSSAFDIFSSPKFVSAIISLVVSMAVAIVEIKVLKRFGNNRRLMKNSSSSKSGQLNNNNPAAISFDSSSDDDGDQEDVSVLDKLKRSPGSVSVGDILIVEC